MYRLIALLLSALLAGIGAVSAHARPTTDAEEAFFDLVLDHQYDQALAEADRLLIADPTSPLVHKARLFLFNHDVTRDLDACVDEYRRRRAAEPDRLEWVIAVLQGEIWLATRIPDSEARKAEYERLRQVLEAEADRHRESPDLPALLARALVLLGSDREAGLALARVLAIDPDHVPFRFSSAIDHLPREPLQEHRRWREEYVKRHPGTVFARILALQAVGDIASEAERGLALEALLPEMLGTRQEDDVRMRLAQMDRKADEHLDAIRARGYSNQYVAAIELAVQRIYSRQDTWAWFSADNVRQQNLRQALTILQDATRQFRILPGNLLVMEARIQYALEDYAATRACVERIAAQGRQEARRAGDMQFLIGDAWYAERNYEQAREAYDAVLEGNTAYPIPSRLRHAEVMFRQYPLLGLAQGSGLFLVFLATLLSVALVAAQIGRARRYFGLAALLAGFATLLQLALFLRSASTFGLGVVMLVVVGFFQNAFLLVAGMLLSARGGLRPVAGLRRLLRGSRPGPQRPWLRPLLVGGATTMLAGIGLLAFTLGFLYLVQPRANQAVRVSKPLESATDRQQAQQVEVDRTAALALVLVAAAMEEILFRWFLFGLFHAYLRRLRGSVLLAIALTSALWGLGHLGGVDPWWFRFVQTTACGFVLGWLRWRHGLEASFACHAGYNAGQIALETIAVRYLVR